jgi:hypothetical protein
MAQDSEFLSFTMTTISRQLWHVSLYEQEKPRSVAGLYRCGKLSYVVLINMNLRTGVRRCTAKTVLRSSCPARSTISSELCHVFEIRLLRVTLRSVRGSLK